MQSHGALGTIHLLWIAILFVACVAPAAPSTSQVQGGVPVAEIRVGVMFPIDDNFNAAIQKAEKELGVKIEVQVLPIPHVDPPRIPPCTRLTHVWLTETVGEIGPFDLYLLDSPNAPHVFKENQLAPVPTWGDGLVPFVSLKKAFSDDKGTSDEKDDIWLGLPQGTQPLLVVYNRDLMIKQGISLPGDSMSWSEISAIAQQLKDKDPTVNVVLSDNSDFLVATCQSLLGAECNEELIYHGDFAGKLANSSDIIDIAGLLAYTNVVPATQLGVDLVQRFNAGQVALTIADSSLLAKLDQTISVGVTRFPGKDQAHWAGATHSYAWVVPATSPVVEQAWNLAKFLINDDDMLKWMIFQGMLPAYKERFEKANELKLLFPPQYIDTQIMPIAEEAKTWKIPINVDPITYATFIDASDKLLGELQTELRSGKATVLGQKLKELQDKQPSFK